MSYYDKEGNPINLSVWYKLREKPNYKRVAETTLPDGILVSTVWLGLDRRFLKGPLLLFETMVFSLRDGKDIDRRRYSTLAEAQAGHEQMVVERTEMAKETKEKEE